jgi:hypothetical protein
MDSPKLREDVRRHMAEEPWVTAGVLCKCAAGIAAVTLLAVMGAHAEKRDEQGQARKPVYETQAPAPTSAEAHRKQVFDERRARFDGTRRATGLAQKQESPGAPALP